MNKSKRGRLRATGTNVSTIVLSRLVGQLARWWFESVDIRPRMSRRQQRAVEVGAVTALGLTTARIIVAKRSSHGSDVPTPAV